MVNNLNIEELLIQANPVLDSEELRLTASEVDARCASILERRGAMQTQTQTRRDAASPPPRRWRKPALAFIISLLVILIAAGGVALLVGGGDPEVTEDPPVTTATTAPTTTTPTTVPEAGPDGAITTPPYLEVPVFTGVVEYHEHDPALGDPGWQATVAIAWAGPLFYEAEVLMESGETLPLLGAGTVFFGDGLEHWINEPDDLGPWPPGMAIEPFRHLFFDGEGVAAWDEICQNTSTEIGVEMIAGRAATHVSCSSALEDYELWIDESTGLVMKMAGPLAVGDLSPMVGRDGHFQFIEIGFGPVMEPDTVRTPSVDGEFPPFHMVQEIATELGTDTIEVWYWDSGRARRDVIRSTDESKVGTFNLISDGHISGCITAENEPGCESVPLSEQPDYDFTTIIGQIPVELMEDNCTELAQGTVVGRPARHFECNVAYEHVGYWRVGAVNHAISEHWYDIATGFRVSHAEDSYSATATLFDVNPTFPGGVFAYNELDFESLHPELLELGEIAPLWSGPLVGGGEFHVGDYRVSEGSPDPGSYLVLFDWFPGCGDVCFSGLEVMQRLHDEFGDADGIEFLTVSEDIESETVRVLERLSIDVPTVYCWNDPDTVTHDQYSACTTPEPGVDPMFASPGYLWGQGVTVVDEAGRVLEQFAGFPGDYESSLEALVTDIAGVNP
jgi:hypothetical protein